MKKRKLGSDFIIAKMMRKEYGIDCRGNNITQNKDQLFFMFELLPRRDLLNLKEDTAIMIDYYVSSKHISYAALYTGLIIAAITSLMSIFLMQSGKTDNVSQSFVLLTIIEFVFLVAIGITIGFVIGQIAEQSKNDYSYIYYRFKLKCINEFIQNKKYF